MKRFFLILLIVALFFIAGMAVGRFVMPRRIQITVININDLVNIIERYNEMKYESEKMKEWNEEAMIAPPKPENKIGDKNEERRD